MKTRDRILACALELFNEHGESKVTTLEIANTLEISPGNLYYHFHGKEPLVMELLKSFKSEMTPLLNPPANAQLDSADYWLFLLLIVEHLSRYRFLFQDLSNLSQRLPKLGHTIRDWINQLKHGIASLLALLKAEGLLESQTNALGQLVEQITLTLLFSLDYQRIIGRPPEAQVVVFQVMMLVVPHLTQRAQFPAEKIARSFLER